MTAHVPSVVLAALAAALSVLRHRQHGRSAGFRTGPLWAWCPAEGREMPHTLDVGVRRCTSCKTTTRSTSTMEKPCG